MGSMIGGPASTRVAVVGTGSIGMRHLRILSSMTGVTPVGVPVRPEREAELRASGFESARSIDQALSNGVAAVVVATDTGRHVADALSAKQLPVLVEKPVARTAQEALKLRSLQRVHVACVLRFDEGLLWVRERLPRLGALATADSECLSWLPSWRPGRDYRQGYAARPGEGGALKDLIHEVDYLQWLLGPVSAVSATLENRGTLGLPEIVEESAQLCLEHAGGLRSTLRLSLAMRPPSRCLRLWGQHGMLRWDGIARTSEWVDIKGKVVESHFWSGPDAMYRAQMEAWLGSLNGKYVGQLATLEEGIAALQICDAAITSSRARARVTT